MPVPFLQAPPRRDQPELIDDTGHAYALFRESFLDIRIVNRFLGGTSAALNPLCRMIGRMPDGETVTVLDIGTGSADIPLELAARMRRLGRSARITALDNHPDVLRLAREETAAEPSISVDEGSIAALPYAACAFDFATCSLTFHHLGDEGCIRAMREMDRVTRRGWVVNDGERAWWTLAFIAAATPLVTRNAITRHDAIASVWRCYTPNEMADMARRAGFPDARVRRAPMGRVVVTRDKGLPARG
ncbi:MAG TPA: methyltransferase domain-containing protein [Armatimonadota bacterium]|jgi:ubiquinone/menaquinone biosynthesis C-methylase UbiE